MRRLLVCAAVLCAFPPAPADAFNFTRQSEPIVLTGDQLPRLVGAKPGRMLAFFRHRRGDGSEYWHTAPIQIDERKRVDFGEVPERNNVPGLEGTVYGTPAAGVTALQYADPKTFVGADDDPAFDANDELVLIRTFRGVRARRGDGAPKGTRPGSATEVRIEDPLGREATNFMYLFRAKGDSAKRNERDFVDYAFSLESGGYRETYRRADGPNPERTSVTAGGYVARFSDRWFYDRLTNHFSSNNLDVLDGYKFSFGPASCVRSEATFNDGEGAFVANLDGPIRAIRSYVGANSGPYTQRTHYFYKWRHVIVTDLRVHPVPGPLVYHDLSEAAGPYYYYFDSVNRAGVRVDGEPDALDETLPEWRMWATIFPVFDGSLWTADRIESTFAGPLLAAARGWYLDDASPDSYPQCWGDEHAYGQGGIRSSYSMPNTDPRSAPTDRLRMTTTELPGLPMPSTEGTAEIGDRLAAELDAPYEVTARAVGR